MLEKQDFEQIKKIVDDSVGSSECRLESKMRGMESALRDEIKEMGTTIRNELKGVEERLDREIDSLIETNIGFLEQLDKIPPLEKSVAQLKKRLA